MTVEEQYKMQKADATFQKVEDLASFLITNFPKAIETMPFDEHIIDVAIRLLSSKTEKA